MKNLSNACIYLVLSALFFAGCNDNYGINDKQPIAPGGKIFHAEFDPLMSNEVHMFVDHIYTYEKLEKNNIEIKYVYTKQYMGKTDAKTELISLPLDNNRETILETKPVSPHEIKGRKFVLKVIDDQDRITVKPLWIVAKISKDQALKIAEEVCRKEKWDFVNTGIEEYADVWAIRTNRASLGGNASIDIDKTSGEVVRKFYIGR